MVDKSAEVLRGPMSKSIPVFAFAFIAYAMTRPADAGQNRNPPRLRARAAAGGALTEMGGEADRFVAAWDLAPFDKRGFSVCVRASRLAKAPGFRLLTGAEHRPSQFEYVWLGDIEAKSSGFIGRPREPLGNLGDALSDRVVAFGLSNIAHWAFTPPLLAEPKFPGEPVVTALSPEHLGAPSEPL
jgi:hypothetical protein